MKSNVNNVNEKLIRLWIARLLSPEPYLGRFVRLDGFRDPDVSEVLGLETEEKSGHPLCFITKRSGKKVREKLASSEDEDPEEPRVLRKKRIAAFRRIKQELEADSGSTSVEPELAENFRMLGKALGFTILEQKILKVVVFIYSEGVLEDAFDLMGNLSAREFRQALARILKVSLSRVDVLLQPASRLFSAGLLKWKIHSRRGHRLELVHEEMAEVLLSEKCCLEAVLRTLVRPCPPARLKFKDYPQHRETLDLIRVYLRRVLRQRRLGVNVYLYGRPGLGKTELVRTLAEDAGVDLYEVAYTDRYGNSLAGKDRLDSLRSAQALLGKRRTFLLFDEAEDIFSGASIFHRSLADERKAWMNRMLEENRVPTFWLSNRVRNLDSAFVRRFDFVFEILPPDPAARFIQLNKLGEGIISQADLKVLSQYHEITPAVFDRAKSVVMAADSDHGKVENGRRVRRLIGQTLKAQGIQSQLLEEDTRLPSLPYHPDYFSADLNLNELAQHLEKSGTGRLCLYGPPGTGKTSFGHWLGSVLDRPVQVERASSILSPYVGESEKNLALAFRRAKESDAILLIDEADTFLLSREGASRSWEISQVNEMLSQLEAFSGILLASTNRMESIDTAAFRRFDLKLKLDFLAPWQTAKLGRAWCRKLGLKPFSGSCRTLLEALTNATPGDFQTCARQHGFRPYPHASAFCEGIALECAGKRDLQRKVMGFSREGGEG